MTRLLYPFPTLPQRRLHFSFLALLFWLLHPPAPFPNSSSAAPLSFGSTSLSYPYPFSLRCYTPLPPSLNSSSAASPLSLPIPRRSDTYHVPGVFPTTPATPSESLPKVTHTHIRSPAYLPFQELLRTIIMYLRLIVVSLPIHCGPTTPSRRGRASPNKQQQRK